MDAPLPVVEPGEDVGAVTRLLNRDNPAVLVRQNGKLVGIVTRFDVVQLLTAAG